MVQKERGLITVPRWHNAVSRVCETYGMPCVPKERERAEMRGDRERGDKQKHIQYGTGSLPVLQGTGRAEMLSYSEYK